MEKKIKAMELTIARKSKKLISMISLGSANRFMGNAKSLAGAAKALRKASNKPAFQSLINEIERDQWTLECLQAGQFIEESE